MDYGLWTTVYALGGVFKLCLPYALSLSFVVLYVIIAAMVLYLYLLVFVHSNTFAHNSIPNFILSKKVISVVCSMDSFLFFRQSTISQKTGFHLEHAFST